ncbi:nucleoside hydrolase [Bacillus thuringiensis]|uniref:nucleoside hydrolase n=1 Tax=Bacillus thuringiensis TaxID=1428 RepID=UPI000722F42D|nr:nucleoside hydrolase [Bacillus thuringiensis]ALQ67990.1 ABC transporter substrate-binding protein [Bacillus thuringiensis]
MIKKVYFNHDGGVDDLISLFLLLQMDNVKLTGVSVIPADCYLEPAMSASRKIIDRFSKEYIEVAASNSRAKNPFPKDWRMHAFYVDALPILNEAGKVVTPVVAKPAHHHLIETLLQTEGKTTLLFTGPLTDLARALYEAPIIEDKIERLVWMGGTFLTAGNVHEPEHDGTAEWNSFWDPEAVARAWESKIEIDLVTLESTNQVPLTIDIRERWAKERKYIGVDFLGQCYAMVPPLVHFSTNSTYYLWDVLTTALVGNTNLAKTKTINSIVHTYGPSQGRTVEFDGGRPVNVVYDVNHNEFFNYITELAKKASS